MSTKTKRFLSIWVLKGPWGASIKETLARTRGECWDKSYFFLVERLGAVWRKQYWKRLRPSRESAKRHGYKVVQIKIFERNQTSAP